MQALKNILAQLHYLNHPYLSTLSATITILVGAFIFFKNPKSRLYRVFLWMTFVIANWFYGNVLSMLYYNNLAVAYFWFQVAYTTVPFISISYYHFYLAISQKKSPLLYFFYAIGISEVIFLWTYWIYKGICEGVYALPNVGICHSKVTLLFYYLSFGMTKYIFISVFAVSLFFREMKKETNLLRKKQLRLFVIGLSFLAMGWIEWAVVFNIPVHATWMVMPPFFVIFAYAIIRYRAMEIDTVIHRTILWAATVLLLITPVSLIISLGVDLLIKVTFFCKATVLTLLLLFFLAYYHRLKPRIDHLFRRRKYDYQSALAEIPTRVGTELELNSLASRLFKELKEVLYLQNGLLLIKLPEATDYTEAGSAGYEALKERGMAKEKTANLLVDSGLIQHLAKRPKALEKDQLEIDPQYKIIADEAMGFFKLNYLELLVPITLKNSVIGILGLGRKENLQTYTSKDIQLLEQLGLNLGISLDNALHHQDIVEKERLSEELKLGREIQIGLLPKEVPVIEGLNIAGLMEPAKEIGGDYFDYLPKAKDRIAVVIGDVSGKGVAAGLLMAVAKTAMQTISSQALNPRDILIRTNGILYQYMKGEKFMTMLYLEYIDKEKKIIYSSAGHEHIIHYQSKNNRCLPIKSGGFMLGILPDIGNMLEQGEFSLEAGDKIVLYTDGATEAENSKRERFGLNRLISSVEKHSSKSAPELLQSLYSDVKEFIGSYPQYDDITLITMEVKEG